MPDLINWALIREPLNWLIVALMLMIFAFGLHLLMGEGGGPSILTGSTGDSRIG